MACPAAAIAESLQQGIRAFQAQDYSTAVEYFDKAVDEHHSLDAAYSHRCLTHLLMNAPAKAEADCTAAIKVNPARPQVRFYRGLARYRLGQYEAAISDFNHHLHQHPEDARAYYNRGLATFADGDWATAIVNYNQAAAYSSILTPIELSNLYNDLGVAYFTDTEPESAIAVLGQAIALNKNDPRGYFNRGCVCHHQGHYAAALEDFAQVLVLDPQHAETYLNRGLVRHQLGDRQGAIADLKMAIKNFQDQGNLAGMQQAKLRLQQLATPQQALG
ncbi:MAG: tetratricopeptide repeat protein [Leptolyngbya sp. SIO1D8]|nr:tetratricopeptide repeat protein [Leptolyngbya sp. SIO1D8]